MFLYAGEIAAGETVSGAVLVVVLAGFGVNLRATGVAAALSPQPTHQHDEDLIAINA